MKSLENDPLFNAIENGIKRDIKVCHDNECYRAALTLIFTAIDAMAHLDMPEDKQSATRSDFINWCDKYLKFEGDETVCGIELYAARCGLVHTYTSDSDFLIRNNCRRILYMDRSYKDVVYNPEVDENIVMVSVEGLTKVFFNGIDNFLLSAFSDSRKKNVVEERLKKLFLSISYE